MSTWGWQGLVAEALGTLSCQAMAPLGQAWTGTSLPCSRTGRGRQHGRGRLPGQSPRSATASVRKPTALPTVPDHLLWRLRIAAPL